ncbi:hypothetical protein ACJX0J_015532, partial [Zea mays]
SDHIAVASFLSDEEKIKNEIDPSPSHLLISDLRSIWIIWTNRLQASQETRRANWDMGSIYGDNITGILHFALHLPLLDYLNL